MLVGLLTPKKEAESRPCDELLENTQVREALQNLIGIDSTLDLASLKSQLRLNESVLKAF
jgi:hypothetical protein